MWLSGAGSVPAREEGGLNTDSPSGFGQLRTISRGARRSILCHVVMGQLNAQEGLQGVHIYL